MTLVERGVDLDPVMAGIVRVGLAASDAGSAGLHAPAATVVPHGHAAVRLRLRSAAAKRVQAVSLGLFLGAELVHELAVLEVAAALAVVVDRLVEDAGRLVLAVERGKLLKEDHVRQHGHEPLGVDAGLLQERLHAERTRLVGMSAHPAAVDRAGTQRDYGVGFLGSLDQMLRTGLVGDAQSLASPAFQHSSLVHEDVIAGLDRLLLGLLHRPAGCRRQGLGVVERDHVQHDRSRIRRLDLRKRLGTTRARRALDPDNRIQLALRCADHRFLEGLRHARRSELGQSGRDRNGAAELHEAAAADAARGKHVLKL